MVQTPEWDEKKLPNRESEINRDRGTPFGSSITDSFFRPIPIYLLLITIDLSASRSGSPRPSCYTRKEKTDAPGSDAFSTRINA
jgi:hypothetical protein